MMMMMMMMMMVGVVVTGEGGTHNDLGARRWYWSE